MKKYWRVPFKDAHKIMVLLGVPQIYIDALFEKNSDFERHYRIKRDGHLYFCLGYFDGYASNWAEGWNWGSHMYGNTFERNGYQYMGDAVKLLRKEKLQKLQKTSTQKNIHTITEVWKKLQENLM